MKHFLVLTCLLLCYASLSLAQKGLDQSNVNLPKKITQDFERDYFLDPGWTSERLASMTYTWERCGSSSFGVGNASAKFNFYQALSGSSAVLVSPEIGRTDIGDSLRFDYAHAQRHFEDDLLKIETSTDAGQSWTELLVMHGNDRQSLSTMPPQYDSLVPTNRSWRTKILGLPIGTNRIRFVGISAHGNNLFIDNIKIFPVLKDVGLVSLQAPGYRQSNPIKPIAVVKNYGTIPQTFYVQLKIGDYYSSIRTVDALPPDSSLKVNFDNLWSVENGLYNLTCFTYLPSDENYSNDTITTSLSLSQWRQAPLPVGDIALNAQKAYSKNDSLYVFSVGGYSDGKVQNTLFKYSINTSSWVKLASMPYPVVFHGTALWGNKLYVIGGNKNISADQEKYTSISVYDIDSNKWSIAPVTMPEGMDHVSAVCANDILIYYIARDSSNKLIGYLYNSKTQNISDIMSDSLPASRSNGLTFNNNELILLNYSGIYHGKIDASNPAIVTWEKKNHRWFDPYEQLFIADIFGNKIICVVGWNLFLYDPATCIDDGFYDFTNYGMFSATTVNTTRNSLLFTNSEIFCCYYLVIDPISEVDSKIQLKPDKFILCQNYPNPFNPETNIRFNLPERLHVKIRVFDMLGRQIALIKDEVMNPGEQKVVFNAKNLSSGVYIYRVEAEGSNGHSFNAVNKMILLK
ncbi:MAG: T9SS type A sorting domain-containing protein [Bacteroidota bacterium]|nr:T9SS type A sorting domain-containing protein [Bacteroidota bacterium]